MMIILCFSTQLILDVNLFLHRDFNEKKYLKILVNQVSHLLCLSVGICVGHMEIRTPAPFLVKFCGHIPMSKKGFGAVLTPVPTPWGLGGSTFYFKNTSRPNYNKLLFR